MKRKFLSVLVFGFLLTVAGCILEPVSLSPCYEGELPSELAALIGGELVDCSGISDDLVCNEAATIDEACAQAAVTQPYRLLPPICDKLIQIEASDVTIGTCQSPGIHGEPCAEDADCNSENELICTAEGDASAGVCEPGEYPDLARLVYVYHRHPDLSLNEFHQYWRDVHALIVEQNAEILGIRGYNQLHTVDQVMNLMIQQMRGTMSPYDGVAEYRVDYDVFSNALSTTEGQEALQELIDDKNNFVDLSRSAVWMAEEHVLRKEPRTQGEVPVKIFTWVGSGLPSLTPEEFQDYYLHNHGSFVVSYAEILGIHQYIQTITIDDPINDTLRAMHGTGLPYYVHAEFIWDFAMMMSLEAMPIMQLISEDEKLFIDFPNSATWYTQEHIIIPVE